MHSTLLAVLALALPAPRQDTALPPPRTVAECGATITRIAVDPAGTTLVVATESGELRAFDLDKDKLLWTRPAPKGMATPNRIRAVAAGQKHVLWVDLVPAPESVDLRKGTDEVGYMMLGMKSDGQPMNTVGMTCDPKDRWAWLALREGVVVRYTPGSKTAYSRRAIEGATLTAIASDGDQVVAIGCEDGAIRFANASSANVDEKKVLRENATEVTALALGGKGGALASGHKDGAVHVWNVASGKTSLKLQTGALPVRAIAVHPKSKWAATGTEGGTLQLWSVEKAETPTNLPVEGGKAVTVLLLADGGKKLVALCGGTGVQLYDVSKR